MLKTFIQRFSINVIKYVLFHLLPIKKCTHLQRFKTVLKKQPYYLVRSIIERFKTALKNFI